jgi:hypothetical protein
LPERDVVPKAVLELIDKHVAAMTPILDPAAPTKSASNR